MRNREVLLFFPSDRSMAVAPPLALLALAPIAGPRGLTVDVIDSTVEPLFLQRIIDQLDKAVCVGISIVTGPMIVEANEVSGAAKAARPEIPSVLGSWHPSASIRR